ncbi:hypothetical protein WJX74_007444 [Apatococcus lobatus]|uniref:non-specific serine/threonine protein kinase n=1 Tax=Apatococcus lobatus TaxID=904363 RepID=A0AAW1SG10_9CHLO
MSEITFARRQRRPKVHKEPSGQPIKAIAATAAQDPLLRSLEDGTGTAAPPEAQPLAGRKPLGQYNRRVAPSQKEKDAAKRNHYIAELKAHFEDVDSYELIEESPQPLRQQQGKVVSTDGAPADDSKPLPPNLSAAEAGVEMPGFSNSPLQLPSPEQRHTDSPAAVDAGPAFPHQEQGSSPGTMPADGSSTWSKAADEKLICKQDLPIQISCANLGSQMPGHPEADHSCQQPSQSASSSPLSHDKAVSPLNIIRTPGRRSPDMGAHQQPSYSLTLPSTASFKGTEDQSPGKAPVSAAGEPGDSSSMDLAQQSSNASSSAALWVADTPPSSMPPSCMQRLQRSGSTLPHAKQAADSEADTTGSHGNSSSTPVRLLAHKQQADAAFTDLNADTPPLRLLMPEAHRPLQLTSRVQQKALPSVGLCPTPLSIQIPPSKQHEQMPETSQSEHASREGSPAGGSSSEDGTSPGDDVPTSSQQPSLDSQCETETTWQRQVSSALQAVHCLPTQAEPLEQSGSRPQRPMSLGLSRRSSTSLAHWQPLAGPIDQRRTSKRPQDISRGSVAKPQDAVGQRPLPLADQQPHRAPDALSEATQLRAFGSGRADTLRAVSETPGYPVMNQLPSAPQSSLDGVDGRTCPGTSVLRPAQSCRSSWVANTPEPASPMHAEPAQPEANEAAAVLHRLSLDQAEANTPLDQLLQLCGQAGESGRLPSMGCLLGRHLNLKGAKKLGEGTYGEAFKAGGIVIKIVPIEGACLVNGFAQTQAFQILAEASISLALSGLRPPGGVMSSKAALNATLGFAETFGCGLCHGPYAPELISAWGRWDDLHGSENDPVGSLPSEQMYAAFLVADGGVDLESFEIRSMEEARSILLQTVIALAVAEEALGFEHRDLHWGNLLIRRATTATRPARLRGVDVICQTKGVEVTLIDFTLSRLDAAPDKIAFSDLSTDPELFQGPKGDPQAETYRRMQAATKGKWQDFTPATNCHWVHYLAEILLTLKMPVKASAKDKRSLRSFRKRALDSSSCQQLLWDSEFAGLWTTTSEVHEFAASARTNGLSLSFSS